MSLTNYQIIESGLYKVGKLLIYELQEELKEQKHIASGELSRSFYSSVYERSGSLYLEILNPTEYMWLVNNGSKNGVIVDWKVIDNWAKQKEAQNELFFKSEEDRERFAASVAKELNDNYLTKGPRHFGKDVARNRYNFIGIAFAKAEDKKIYDSVENEISKEIEKQLKNSLSNKVIELTIS